MEPDAVSGVVVKWGLAAAAVGAGFLYFALRAIPKRTVTFDLGMVITGDSSTVADVAGLPVPGIEE